MSDTVKCGPEVLRLKLDSEPLGALLAAKQGGMVWDMSASAGALFIGAWYNAATREVCVAFHVDYGVPQVPRRLAVIPIAHAFERCADDEMVPLGGVVANIDGQQHLFTVYEVKHAAN